ncbi:RsiV family protein [Dysgonomonas sp. OttesenSCG-928-M03]|nr:RsiV family protein [Dysgonomonas sp. OttesenSCG-928-M03]
MRKLTLIVLLTITVLGACKRTKPVVEPSDTSKWAFEELSEKKELFLNNDSTKGGMKLSFEFNYPTRSDNDSVLSQIQSGFILAFAGEEYKTLSPKEAFGRFVKQVEKEGLDMGKMAEDDGPDFSNYLKNITTTVSDTTSMTITAKTYSEDYTGGAHGSHQTTYYNIDIHNGEVLKEKNLFKDDSESALTSFIKEALDDMIKNGKQITILDPESVKPNGNFYFDDKDLVYVFNEYEIAPYSDGLIEVCIPYEKVRTLFVPEYEKLIAIKTKTE